MTGELLFEIGTEEIPSDFFDAGVREFQRLAEVHFRESRLEVRGGVESMGTPRRLVLIGKGIAEKQEDTVQEIMGPPKRAAFDDKGNPSKAGIGFAQKQGVSVDELQCRETPKGEYLFVRRMIPGRPTKEILSELLPGLVGEIPWPKSMRWGSVGFAFVRPIHWILALFDGEVIPFEVAGVRSGNHTKGHRFMAPQGMEIKGLDDYLDKMKSAFVVVDPTERSSIAERAVRKAAQAVSGIPKLDPELLATVTNLVEYPSAVCGGFDEAFLDIPDPVLITAMKKHQKYFALYTREGRLLPHFVAVNNTLSKDEKVVQRGHERVLRARLADAAFFYREDRGRPLLARLEDLKGVIYQARLGTSFSKVERFTRLARYLAETAAPGNMEGITLAARLCKCDLETEMVKEFPTLQGVMGEEYARLDGHPEEVCLAIREHYLPDRAGGELPRSLTGAIVGLADRMDTITGCFAVGLEPTGAADPFALRRHALAIIRIIEEFRLDLSLQEFISRSVAILKEEITFDHGSVFGMVLEFFRERYKQMMLRSEFKTDLVEAVISSEFDRISLLRPRIEQLEKFVRVSSEFESLVLTSKRISNILKKQDERLHVNQALFREPCESNLWASYLNMKGQVESLIEEGRYFEALEVMVQLRKPVDGLFEGVEILTKEGDLRKNRLGLLQELERLFLRIADFSRFSI